ncbi:MAG: efflux RND transporter permease subunit, partial [Treponema sp.]|nr:efflux RND transporter permease subunit [Treponema sp.]
AQGGGGFVRLGDIAAVGEQERNHESRSRLNGKNIALAAVFAGDGADLGKLSAAIGEELARFPALEYSVLSDRGEAERRARLSALGAALQGACAVALLSALISARGSSLKRNLSLALNCALTVPAVIFFSAALLVLWGFALDKLVLAGLSAGVGAAVDAAILCAEYLRSCKTREEGKAALESLRFPLASGAVTTVIALLPLMARREGGMASVAWAVAAVNLTAMVLALTLLPPLFFWGRFDGKGAPLREAAVSTGVSARTKGVSAGTKAAAAAVFRRLRFFSALNPARRCRRFLAAAVVPLGRKKTAAAAAGLWFLLGALGIGALLVSGADVEQDYSEDSVYAQVEFDGGLHMEETDGRLVPYGELLKDHPGIKSVQTVARTGTGSVLVSFDPRLMEGRAVRTLMKDSPVEGGFVYFLESSGRDRSWRLRVSGDEPERCQKAAEEAARICAALPEVTETVLNFKEGGPRLDIIPDRRKLVQAGLSFGVLGRTVRRSVHGPVAYKRIGEEGETDVRIRGGTEAPGREEVLGIPLMGASPVILSRTVLAEDSREPSSIQREDRRRGASITIRTAAADPRRIRDRVMAALANLELPPGYAVSFDPPAIRAAEEAGGQGALFLLALLFCYLVIAAFKESFTFPLAALAVVPPSLAVPALVMVLWGRPLNAVSAAAFVAVSGIAVNAAVLAADALQRAGAGGVSFYRVLREKAPVLAATAGTTVAGALPFLFIGSGAAGVIKTLSLVSALGVAASAFCALTLIPALVTLFPGILLPWKRSFV